ncbi:MAG: type III polyketide synthase [Planctomycetia bacterium]|nr:type III polyketide synthase [Planctomycetia bacterium]
MTQSSSHAAILGLGTAQPEYLMAQDDAVMLAQEICCRDEAEKKLVKVLYRKAGVKQRATCVPYQIALEWLAAPATVVSTVGAAALHAEVGASKNGSSHNGNGHAASANGRRRIIDGMLDDAHIEDMTEEELGDLPESDGPVHRGPSTAERMQIFAEAAPELAVHAAELALIDSGVAAAAITHLVTVTCTGFFAPGIDISIINRLGLRGDVGRIQVGFMGCHGAINGLRAATAIAQADPKNRVLLCAVELCSLHYSFQWDPTRAVGNAVFADGSAALVIGHADSAPNAASANDGGTLRCAATGSCVIPDSTDAMSWNLGDNGFEMFLSSRVPDLIGKHLRPWFESWLAAQGLKIEDVGSWAVHPGGPRILSSVEESLGLPRSATAVSREVLAECGNMSSPTVLFILQRLRASGAKMPCVALGFGPGLAAEAALFV